MKNFSFFDWVDYFNDDLGTLLTMLGGRFNYYWQQMTLLSMLILIMILAILGLAWLQIADRKKFASRAYWRGYFCGIKQNNTNNTKLNKEGETNV